MKTTEHLDSKHHHVKIWIYVFNISIKRTHRNYSIFVRRTFALFVVYHKYFVKAACINLDKNQTGQPCLMKFNRERERERCNYQSLYSHPGSIVYSVLAVWKNADRPRRQVVMQITKSHFCKRSLVVICKECSASSRLWLEYMSL